MKAIILTMNIEKLQKYDEKIDRISAIIVIYSLSLMLLLVTIQVFLRYLFNLGIYWIPELARYILVTFSFFAGSMALRRNELAGISLVINAIPIRIRRWIDFTAIILVLLFCIIGIIYGFKTAILILQTGQPSPSMRIPIGFAYLPIPIALVLMLFSSLISAYDILFKCSLERHKKYNIIQ
jgi:TRAP-type C4-dicarboxylate transport system permease small subunit